MRCSLTKNSYFCRRVFAVNLKDILYYQTAFSQLRRNRQNGGAPHKPVLLLSVLRLCQNGDIRSPYIEPSPLLYHTFKTLWRNLVPASAPFSPSFYYPFFHLQSEPFWQLIPVKGQSLPREVTSLKRLQECVACAKIDDELFELLERPLQNTLLEKHLLEHYFNVSYTAYNQITVPPLETELTKPEYIAENHHEAPGLVAKDSEEDRYMRSQLFKVAIPQIYDHTCAISRLRLNSTDRTVSMVDACHIVPFAESHDDSIGNGIALCPNLHRAFDRGLIAISDNYTVLVNDNFAEDASSAFALSQFAGQPLKLPYATSFYPDKRNLAAHRARHGFRQ